MGDQEMEGEVVVDKAGRVGWLGLDRGWVEGDGWALRCRP